MMLGGFSLSLTLKWVTRQLPLTGDYTSVRFSFTFFGANECNGELRQLRDAGLQCRTISGGAPLLRLLGLLLVCLASCVMKAQSPAESDANSHPAILGTLDKGKYSNHVIGFEIRLDPVCALTNEAAAIERAYQFPERLSLTIGCDDDTVMLSSFPLYPDEQADLRTQADPSLAGAVDALRFKKRGHWQKMTTGGTEVLVQELTGRSHSDEAVLGFYNAFWSAEDMFQFLPLVPRSTNCSSAKSAKHLGSIRTRRNRHCLSAVWHSTALAKGTEFTPSRGILSEMAIFRQPRLKVMHTSDSEAFAMS